MLDRIHWLGHDAFRIDGPQTIYFDPYELGGGNPVADVVFISHDHGDHCSPEDVVKVRGKDTLIVTIASAAKKLAGNIRIVKPGDTIRVRGPVSYTHLRAHET